MFYPAKTEHENTFSYLVVDPIKRTATVFYHNFGASEFEWWYFISWILKFHDSGAVVPHIKHRVVSQIENLILKSYFSSCKNSEPQSWSLLMK